MNEQNNIKSQMPTFIGKAPQGKDPSGTGTLPPNGTYNLWQMLMAIFKYEKNNLDNNAELQKDWAKNLGGKDGFFSHLFDIGKKVGELEAQGLRDAAWGDFGSAIVAGVQLGAIGAQAISTNKEMSPAQAGHNDVVGLENQINGNSTKLTIGAEDGPVYGPATKEAATRVDAWMDGSQEVSLGEPGSEQYKINEEAARHVGRDAETKQAVLKKIQERKKAFQGEMSNAETKYNSRLQMFSMMGNGATSGVQGGAKMAQANAADAKGKASAGNTIQQQVVQSLVGQEQKAQQNLEAALQSANQWAQGFAQAAASQVRG